MQQVKNMEGIELAALLLAAAALFEVCTIPLHWMADRSNETPHLFRYCSMRGSSNAGPFPH